MYLTFLGSNRKHGMVPLNLVNGLGASGTGTLKACLTHRF